MCISLKGKSQLTEVYRIASYAWYAVVASDTGAFHLHHSLFTARFSARNKSAILVFENLQFFARQTQKLYWFFSFSNSQFSV